ncbi:MAG: LysE/ArgO family amino acid transporter, partial [Dehalococcoidia bacterium]
MIEPIITGFLLGSSLIIAIGAQNIFVLRQGIIRQHIFATSIFCSISDTILIFLGISGVSFFF